MNMNDNLTTKTKHIGLLTFYLGFIALSLGITFSFYSIYFVNRYFNFVIKCLGCE
jgi:hypothetical protein